MADSHGPQYFEQYVERGNDKRKLVGLAAIPVLATSRKTEPSQVLSRDAAGNFQLSITLPHINETCQMGVATAFRRCR